MTKKQTQPEVRKYQPVQERKVTQAPAKIDLLIYGLAKTIVGVLLLYIIYAYWVDYIRSLPNYTIFLEILFVFSLMLFCDILAGIFAHWVAGKVVHRWHWLRNKKKRKNTLFAATDYSIYTFLRTLSLVFMWVWVLSAWYYTHLSSPWNNYAFLISWFSISMGSKFLAWIITNKIFPS